jgi:hypothetical protein
MRRALLVLAFAVGCSDHGPSLVGTYDLRSIEGQPLPYRRDAYVEVFILRSRLVVSRGGRYTQWQEIQLSQNSGQRHTSAGTWQFDAASSFCASPCVRFDDDTGGTFWGSIDGDAFRFFYGWQLNAQVREQWEYRK